MICGICREHDKGGSVERDWTAMKHELLWLAIATAHRDTPTIDPADLATMCCAVLMNAVESLSPAERWVWLASGLMAPYPSHFFAVLRACKGLRRLLPGLDALFGVPQLSDAAEPVDVGLHQMRVLDETARIEAPVAVRFAALMHKIGKGGTPREIWPSHFKHEQRAHALLDDLVPRIAVPAEILSLARMVIDEGDRVHRVSDMRAGPIAAMLERLRCESQPERFEQLLCVCTCDYAAYAGHSAADYDKARRLRLALAAYADTDVKGLSSEAALQERAHAIAVMLRGSVLMHDAD